VGINLATSSPGWAISVGVALVVLVWAGLEWWRAVDVSKDEPEPEPDRRPVRDGEPGPVRIDQRAQQVRGGEVVGAHGRPEGAELEVVQNVTEVGEGGSVIGYRDPN
jgi:hypothetical protein